ncbi:MAG: AraC family transcriptional regulator [Planctomycetota bacterium]|jgi:AraC-like DNA-binding protein|nr:AraC family transcriptional regulator [Planctomycetota bacterium]
MSYPDHMDVDGGGAPYPINDRIGLRLLCIGAVRLTERWSYQRFSDPFWRLYLNKHDGAELVVEGKPFPMGGRKIYLIPAWVTFGTRPSKDVDHIYVHFDLPGLPGAMVRHLFNAPIAMDGPGRWERDLVAIGDELARRRTTTPRMIGEVKGLIEILLGRLFESLPPEERLLYQQQLRGMGTIRPALDMIERDPGADLGNTALGRVCCCSADHVIRMFRKNLGQTPAQYVAERRVAWAARRLAFSDESIDAIAERSGFANRNYFTRVFTRHTGVPPASYRRMSGN